MYDGERINSITHLVGAVLALVGFGALLTISIQQWDAALIASFTVFGITLILLYTMSTLYHSFRSPKLKAVFRQLDHVCIYLLIAGTYTPFMAVTVGGTTGLIMLVVIWALAVVGLLLDILPKRRIKWLQITIYLVMGWVCVVVYHDLSAGFPAAGLTWLFLGGVAYTVGVIFYVLDGLKKLKHAHGIWHMFVLAGSCCHFVSVVAYVR
ncbi:hemolysin III family protein [Gilvimarinus sp. SDUM040013]|uniref:Hemolysin III family protein n=1 Tax=Gilvimarinus gilvus TaxID=3058038 RepID=A0ABU4S395_9GAMM|nr:hemolysin III family protein [Gilvimarinus sp. SDUM040013]MDO3387239.1 hemolysin III family protein [Gilvimarinus sp. SDUM040013]MDX6851404.1 hemolysin III family protein [Gilvimarinus sp. SDUM040013]